MPTLIDHPTVIPAAGTKPKVIQEFAGRVNTGTPGVSIARMVSPQGWIEPARRRSSTNTRLFCVGDCELHSRAALL